MLDVFTWPVGRAGDLYSSDDFRAAPVSYVLIYAAASLAGGTVTGGILSLAGYGVSHATGSGSTALLWLLAPVAVAAAYSQALGQVAPFPQRRAQVPTSWLRWRRHSATAGAFGFVIGSGALTYLKHATAWGLAALAFAAPSPSVGLALGATYGAARASPLVLTWGLDRVQRPRPSWERLGHPQGVLGRLLVPLSLLTYCALLAIS